MRGCCWAAAWWKASAWALAASTLVNVESSMGAVVVSSSLVNVFWKTVYSKKGDSLGVVEVGGGGGELGSLQRELDEALGGQWILSAWPASLSEATKVVVA